MKIRTVAICAFMLVLSTPGFVLGKAGEQGFSGRIGSEVSISPSDTPGIMICEVTITDLATGEILSSPRVTFKPGQPATIRSGVKMSPDSNEEYYILMEVVVSEDAKSASYTSTISLHGEVISKQAAHFKFH